MPSNSVPVRRASRPGGSVLLLLALLLAPVLAVGALAQGKAAGEGPSYPSAAAKLIFEGRQISTVPCSLTPRGPLLNLPAVAAVLGVEIVVGPLGDSHRLILKDKEVIVGPERAVIVIVPSGEREGRPEHLTFLQAPVKTALGLEVPLELIVKILGEEIGIDFVWDQEALELRLTRRQIRTLAVAVEVFHQHSSTVEIRFSAVPRYRVEQLDGAVEIRFLGDRLQLPVDKRRATSELVRGVQAAADRLRIDLATGARAAEPRLFEEGEPRLIVEVFRQTAPRATSTAEPTVERPSGIRAVVIDPGHGGVEAGAVGPGGTAEKNLTLAIAKSLKRLLERRLRLRVVLTRGGDEDVSLETRTAIANENQADLFISLHFNSYAGAAARGAETYFLSREASDRLAAEVAEAENYPGGQEDPEGALQLILWDLAQTYHLAESQRFANLVQTELNLTLGLRDRGVKQAPFRVLMGATMPAVLVELGFISNPQEEAKLQSPIEQAKLVNALFRAVQLFKTQMEDGDRLGGVKPSAERGASPPEGTP